MWAVEHWPVVARPKKSGGESLVSVGVERNAACGVATAWSVSRMFDGDGSTMQEEVSDE